MPRLLQIAQLGHPILRERAKKVEDVRGPAIQELIDDMMATCEDAGGVGLAAPQVYQPWRIFIVASHPSPRYPDAPTMEPTAIINPELSFPWEEMESGWEGCLSIPGIRGRVLRYSRLLASFYNQEGEKQERAFEGFVARIVQHENDHLDATVFLDRTTPDRLITEKEYQKLLRSSPKAL